jgi:GT2 family glycosyltransferase
MKIFAIIVTYNGMQWYDRCFKSLQQSEVSIQIIVVDNASTDSTIEYIKEKYPEIILIESNQNIGFAKGNNLGLRYALDHKADYVFLLNQDAWVNQTNTISELIKQSEKHPEYAILSPLQLYGNGDKIEQEVLMYFARNSRKHDDFISDIYFDRLTDLYNVPYACAVSWLLPKETVKSIGGFDPIFYHYGEDDNYIQRVKYFGGKICICPKVSISHDIEERTFEYRDVNLDWKKYLLIQLGDINVDYDIQQLVKDKFKILFVQLLRLNRKLLKKSYPEYKYLREIQSELIQSRTQNKIKQANWL